MTTPDSAKDEYEKYRLRETILKLYSKNNPAFDDIFLAVEIFNIQFGPVSYPIHGAVENLENIRRHILIEETLSGMLTDISSALQSTGEYFLKIHPEIPLGDLLSGYSRFRPRPKPEGKLGDLGQRLCAHANDFFRLSPQRMDVARDKKPGRQLRLA